MGLIMTNSEFKVKLKDFENKIHEEGYSDIHFERYNMVDGSWGIKCIHTDYQDACYFSGTFGDFQQKYNKVVDLFDLYVRNNSKYM